LIQWHLAASISTSLAAYLLRCLDGLCAGMDGQCTLIRSHTMYINTITGMKACCESGESSTMPLPVIYLMATLLCSNFTPKPHTPFQWHSVSTAEFLRKQVRPRVQLTQSCCARCTALRCMPQC